MKDTLETDAAPGWTATTGDKFICLIDECLEFLNTLKPKE